MRVYLLEFFCRLIGIANRYFLELVWCPESVLPIGVAWWVRL
jgi:hypothetical protein